MNGKKKPVLVILPILFKQVLHFLINFDNANYLVVNGFRFFFYLNKHEPIHIHVSRGDSEARIVLLPEIDVSYCRGFKKNELRSIIEEWHKTFDK